MNRPLVNKAFAVGLLVAVCALAFLVAFTFFRRGGYDDDESYLVHAHFKDATGVTWKSRVQIAGIQIGEVARISLAGNRARLDLRIRNEVDLHKDACLTKRFPSALLPDALLETAPGSPPAPRMRDLPVEQREITCVNEGVTVDQMLESFSKIAEDVSRISGELADTVAGSQGSIRDIVQNLSRVSSQIAATVDEGQERVDAILRNTQQFTGTLRDVAARDAERYHAIARNVEDASARLVKVLDSVQRILGEEDDPQLRDSVAGVRQSIDRLNRSLEEVEKVALRIGEGKGVAGKLLADERLGEKVGNALEGASDYVDRLTKLKVEVQLRSEWLLQENGSKTFAGVKLMPRPDKFYLFELVNDPRGVDTITNETVTVEQGGSVSTTRTARTLNEKKLRFSLQLGKRYGPATFRVGIIESSGGAGADLHLLEDRLTLSFSAYQFDRPISVDYPNFKFWANYTFWQYFFVTAGTDDILNRWEVGRYPGGRNFSFGRDIFVGGGLVFTDDDLKTLIGAGGSAVAGAAGSQ